MVKLKEDICKTGPFGKKKNQCEGRSLLSQNLV
jgi:hypothetical protein